MCIFWFLIATRIFRETCLKAQCAGFRGFIGRNGIFFFLQFCTITWKFDFVISEWALYIGSGPHIAPTSFYNSPEWTNLTLALERAWVSFSRMVTQVHTQTDFTDPLILPLPLCCSLHQYLFIWGFCGHIFGRFIWTFGNHLTKRKPASRACPCPTQLEKDGVMRGYLVGCNLQPQC